MRNIHITTRELQRVGASTTVLSWQSIRMYLPWQQTARCPWETFGRNRCQLEHSGALELATALEARSLRKSGSKEHKGHINEVAIK